MIYRARVQKSIGIVVLLLAAMLASRSTMAQQEATKIAIGDTVEGTITDKAYQQLYVLTAKAGDSVVISMIAKDNSSLDPYLLLEDSSGKTLLEDDDSAGGHNAQIAYAFGEDGDYTIVATRFGQVSGSSGGDYTLSVKVGGESVATTAATTAATEEATVVATEEGTTVATEEATTEPTEEGAPTVTRTRRPTATRVKATPTEEVTPEATMEATEEATTEPTEEGAPTATRTRRPTATRVKATPTEEVTPEATMEATEEVTTEPTEEGAPTATRTRRPTATRVKATPTVEEATPEETQEATAEESPTPRPTRRATATRRPTRATATPTPSDVVQGGTITLDEPATGDIDDSKVFYVYDYDGTAGEQLTLSLEAEGGLKAVLIFAPADASKSAIKNASAKSANQALKFDVTVPDDGAYWIIVTRVDGVNGDTSGSFTLTVSAGGAATVQQIDVSGSPARVVGNLASAGLVPKGGKQIATLPTNSFTRASTSGLKFLPIMGNAAAKNMVLNFQVNWTTAGPSSGCGMGFRRSDSQNFSFVLLTNDNKVALFQVQGQKNLIQYFEQSTLFSPKSTNTVTVIAIDNTITVYVNGQLQTSQQGQAVRGSFELEMFNPEGNTTVTNCRFPTGWVWSFDR